MRILIATLLAAFAMTCSLAHAQGYRWVDKDGKVRYGYVPPPGVKATPMKAPPGPSTSPAAAGAGGGAGAARKDAAAKNAKKGPLTPAEQEQAYRERQLKAKEEKEKSDKEAAVAEQNKQACASAQESLRSLERGSRVASVNAQGETVYLEDNERAVRIAQARKVASETCK